YLSRYVQRVTASGRTCVSVWACIIQDGLGPLICLHGKFTDEKYGAIIDSVLIPYVLDNPFPEGDYTF
ncbi:hypothetical protein MRX96_050155, partial [Rhipicephalus microplus]